MSRLTITLSEPRYRALKETAAQRGKTIGQLIDAKSRRSHWRKLRCRQHAKLYE